MRPISHPRGIFRTLRLGATLGSISILTISFGAGAHIHPHPEEVETGTTTTISLEIGHGCEEEATTSVEIEGDPSLHLKAIPSDGWTAGTSSTANVAVVEATTPIDADTPATFSLTVTPERAGTFTLPMIQKCGSAQNAWTEEEVPGGPEPEFPAPELTVVGEDVIQQGAADTSSSSEGASSEDSANTSQVTGETAQAQSTKESEEGSNAAGIVVGVIVAAAVIGGGLAGLVKRQRNAGN